MIVQGGYCYRASETSQLCHIRSTPSSVALYRMLFMPTAFNWRLLAKIWLNESLAGLVGFGHL